MRPIDADEMLKRIESWNTSDAMDKALYNFTLNRIIEQPTVDAVHVVRCKDCKYRITDTFDEPACEIVRDCGGYNATVKDTDYCSWGERRDQDETD